MDHKKPKRTKHQEAYELMEQESPRAPKKQRLKPEKRVVASEHVQYFTAPSEHEDEEEEKLPWQKKVKKYAKMALPHVALITALLLYVFSGSLVYQALEYGYHGTKPLCNGSYDVQNSWRNFESSMLFALTVLTTCGYDALFLTTPGAKMFHFFYGMFGIPLMFLTGADVGKFLSDTILSADYTVITKVKTIPKRLAKLFCCCARGRVTVQKSPSTRLNELRQQPSEFTLLSLQESENLEPERKLWFPVGTYLTLIFLYCCLGSLLFMFWEDDWRFVHYFHFSFCCITTIALGSINCHSMIYLMMVIAYCIIGLAIITMCMDLAGTHLKHYFEILHYFGSSRFEKFDLRRRLMAALDRLGANATDDLVLAMEALAHQKGDLTWEDIKRYLDQQCHWRDRPYIPRQSAYWKYIDDSTSASTWTLLRRNSITSDMLQKSSSTPEYLADYLANYEDHRTKLDSRPGTSVPIANSTREAIARTTRPTIVVDSLD